MSHFQRTCFLWCCCYLFFSLAALFINIFKKKPDWFHIKIIKQQIKNWFRENKQRNGLKTKSLFRRGVHSYPALFPPPPVGESCQGGGKCPPPISLIVNAATVLGSCDKQIERGGGSDPATREHFPPSHPLPSSNPSPSSHLIPGHFLRRGSAVKYV